MAADQSEQGVFPEKMEVTGTDFEKNLNQHELHYIQELTTLGYYILENKDKSDLSTDTKLYYSMLYNIEVMGQVCVNITNAVGTGEIRNLITMFGLPGKALKLARDRISHRVFRLQTPQAKQHITTYINNELPALVSYLNELYKWGTKQKVEALSPPAVLLDAGFMKDLSRFLKKKSKKKHTNKERFQQVLSQFEHLMSFIGEINSGQELSREPNTNNLYACCHSILVLCDSLKVLKDSAVGRNFAGINWTKWQKKRNKVIHKYAVANGHHIFQAYEQFLQQLYPGLVEIWNEKFADEDEKIVISQLPEIHEATESTTETIDPAGVAALLASEHRKREREQEQGRGGESEHPPASKKAKIGTETEESTTSSAATTTVASTTTTTTTMTLG